MKKFVRPIVAFVLIGIALAACATPPEQPPAPPTATTRYVVTLSCKDIVATFYTNRLDGGPALRLFSAGLFGNGVTVVNNFGSDGNCNRIWYEESRSWPSPGVWISQDDINGFLAAEKSASQ